MKYIHSTRAHAQQSYSAYFALKFNRGVFEYHVLVKVGLKGSNGSQVQKKIYKFENFHQIALMPQEISQSQKKALPFLNESPSILIKIKMNHVKKSVNSTANFSSQFSHSKIVFRKISRVKKPCEGEGCGIHSSEGRMGLFLF